MNFEKKHVGGNRIREEDMINQLPDSLLCEILFNLPTNDVVKTSLLCRRWRNLWQYVPRLDLVINGFTDYDKFDFLERFIDLNSGLCLQRVKLMYIGYGCNSLNKLSIDNVIKQKIQHLDVGSILRYDKVKVSPTIYTSCERLVSLKLFCASLPKPPDSVSLPCLKIMDLQEIEIVDSLDMEMLISVCPALENLTMDKMYGVKVSSQSLLSFCLANKESVYRKTHVVMQTPKLKSLKLNHHLLQSIIINDMSSLVKLNLDDLIYYGSISFPIFFIMISCVRDLTLSFDILQDFCKLSKSKPPPKFHNLSILRIKNMIFGSWEYLLLFLESCPNLESLVMKFQGYNWGINFSDVPQCVLSSLEFVEVKAKSLADMSKLGSYFMENSTVLKKFTLRLDHIEEHNHVKLKKLFTLPRRSNSCEVVVHSRTFGKYIPYS